MGFFFGIHDIFCPETNQNNYHHTVIINLTIQKFDLDILGKKTGITAFMNIILNFNIQD